MWGLSEEQYTQMTADLSQSLHLPKQWTPTHRQKGLVDYMKEASQATLRHVYEEGEKPCQHTSREPVYFGPKWGCPECRADLRKEAYEGISYD